MRKDKRKSKKQPVQSEIAKRIVMKSIELALIVTVVFGLLAGSAFAIPHVIYKVSDSLGVTYHHNWHPEVAGEYLAWGNYSDGLHKYRWRTSAAHTTYGGSKKCYPVVNENGNVVWTNNEDNAISRDHYWNSTDLTTTERAVDFMSLDQDGNTAAWATYFINTTGRYDISYCVNNGTPTVISGGTAWTRNRAPDTDSSSVVWHDDATSLVYHYDIGTTTLTQIGDGMVTGTIDYGQGVKVDGNYVVWNHKKSGVSNANIMLHNISAGTNTMIWDSAITGTEAINPKISGNYVVWEENAVNSNVFLYDIAGATTIQLTTTGMNRKPSIDGDYVAWVDISTDDYDIYVYEISTATTILVTDESWTETSNGNPTYGAPQVYDIGGEYVVTWTYYDDVNGLAAVALSAPIPEPATLCMVGITLAATAGIIRKKLR